MRLQPRLTAVALLACACVLAPVRGAGAAQPVSGASRAAADAASARQADADTAVRLSDEGALLYGQEEVKLDGYQYCSQAVALAEAGEFRESLRAAGKALHVGQATGNEDLIAKAQRDMAIAYSYSGNPDKAIEFAQLALQHQPRDPSQVVGPANKIIGDARQRQGDYAAAVASYEAALAGSSERYRPLVRASLVNALLRAGDTARARREYEAMPAPDAPALAETWERTGAGLLLAEGHAAQARERYRALVGRAAGPDADYRRLWALEGLARSEQALGDDAAALAALAQALDGLDAVRARFRSEEFKMGLFSDVQAVFERAIDLSSKLGRPRQAFEYSERSRSRAMLDEVRGRARLSDAATGSISLPALQAMLRADERVVEFHSLHDRLLAWVVSKDGIREVSYDLPRASLEALVGAFRDSITDGLLSAVEGARQVGDTLVGPLALEPGTRLVIVPHGALHYLPFQALRPGGEYLVQRHPIAIEPSISVAAQLAARDRAGAQGRLVAFGNPEVGPEYALPSSEEEVKRLAALFARNRVYLQAEATKTRFRESAGGASLLHVAAHAEPDRVDPLYSRILLANENGRQNFLEAHEVLDLDLGGVSMVTLSACETGLGRVAGGDEVLGFSRAFLAAGTSTLVLSLWPVDDVATESLMTTFYGELAKGVDAQTAMQRAQLALMARPDYAHPFFWAPFNLIGDWRMTTGS